MSGLHVGELLSLKLDRVNFDSSQIRVMGKGGKEHFGYMSTTVYKVLFKYVCQQRPKVASDYSFLHGNGRPLTRFYAAHCLQAYGRRAGMTGVRCSPHTLRHSFAVNYLRNGGDTFTLQRILGHSTLEMTRQYAEVSDSDVERMEKVYSPAEKLGLWV